MFSEELKELIKKKETIINDLDGKAQQEAIAHFLKNNPNILARIDAH